MCQQVPTAHARTHAESRHGEQVTHAVDRSQTKRVLTWIQVVCDSAHETQPIGDSLRCIVGAVGALAVSSPQGKARGGHSAHLVLEVVAIHFQLHTNRDYVLCAPVTTYVPQQPRLRTVSPLTVQAGRPTLPYPTLPYPTLPYPAGGRRDAHR